MGTYIIEYNGRKLAIKASSYEEATRMAEEFCKEKEEESK